MDKPSHQPENPSQPEPEKVYRLMETNQEALEAIEQVVGAAQRELRIFDTSPRALSDRGFGHPARIADLQVLLLGTREHRMRIVLHDTQGMESTLPRLMDLLTRFSGQVHIHRTLGVATEARDSLIIADSSHFWRKLHVEQSRSVVTLHDSAATLALCERFEEIWENSEIAVASRTLGL